MSPGGGSGSGAAKLGPIGSRFKGLIADPLIMKAGSAAAPSAAMRPQTARVGGARPPLSGIGTGAGAGSSVSSSSSWEIPPFGASRGPAAAAAGSAGGLSSKPERALATSAAASDDLLAGRGGSGGGSKPAALVRHGCPTVCLGALTSFVRALQVRPSTARPAGRSDAVVSKAELLKSTGSDLTYGRKRLTVCPPAPASAYRRGMGCVFRL